MSKPIEFLRKKDYKFIKDIGQGGTGKTVLLEDEFIKETFVCKKYSPYYEEHKEIYFRNFIDEIKLLHLLYHLNVVRVFNYHLYPESTTGYILMEYIIGESISSFLKENPDKLNDVFVQTISGFKYLEENNVLHRDIRPDNIMVSENGIVKIIDFGFGKKINFEDSFDNSVSLNWRYPIPKDFEKKSYDFRTEIYFVGKLFEEIIHENNLENFGYPEILRNMTEVDPESRINSFFEIERKIIGGNYSGIEFTRDELSSYSAFANHISNLFTQIENSSSYVRDPIIILNSLEEAYQNSMLESFVQNNVTIARCFIQGQYYYSKAKNINVSHLKYFVKLFKSVSPDKRKIILNNLWQRLDAVKRYEHVEEDDLPF